MRIGAIDPGRVHGFAVYHTDTGGFQAWEGGTEDISSLADCHTIVCESYLITDSSNTQQTDALGMIGVVEKMCESEAIELVMQTPTAAKKFAKDDKLKALGWFQRTKDGHANDATRHLLRYLVKNHVLRADDLKRMTTVLRP